MKKNTEEYVIYADNDSEEDFIVTGEELEQAFNEDEYMNELFHGDFEAYLNEKLLLGEIHYKE